MTENNQETKEYVLEKDCELRFEVEKYGNDSNEKKTFTLEVCLYLNVYKMFLNLYSCS